MSGQYVTIELDKRGRTNLCCANNNQQSELFADTNFSQRLPFLLVGARLPAQPAHGRWDFSRMPSCFCLLASCLLYLLLMCRSRVHCHTPFAHVAFTRRTAAAGFACNRNLEEELSRSSTHPPPRYKLLGKGSNILMQKQAMRSCTIAAHRWPLPYPSLGCHFFCQGIILCQDNM